MVIKNRLGKIKTNLKISFHKKKKRKLAKSARQKNNVYFLLNMGLVRRKGLWIKFLQMNCYLSKK